MGDTQPRRIAEQCNGRGSTAGRFRPTRLHSGGNVRRETLIRGASFTGTSDLTIVAPIRKGLVPALDAVTYKTRVQRVLKTLHLGRQTAHEYEFARILSDAVERVGRIHSIRIAIIEPEDKVMLAVTFDGSWESYIRVIWQKVSRSLDLIFCNTEGYVTGWDHTFEEWGGWLRWRQAQSSFLYSPPGLTYQDTQYLRMYERRLRGTVDPHDPDELAKADLATTRIRIPTAEEISDELTEAGTDPTNLGLNETLDPVVVGRPAFRQGMRSLAGLYRLAELHLPGTTDGNILHRAASELLREFVPMVDTPQGRAQYQVPITYAEKRFQDALDWLRKTPKSFRTIPTMPDAPDESEYTDVQGGILQSYADVSDGCLLLLAFDGPDALGDFLNAVTPTSAKATLGEGDIAVNMAMTLEGLRLAGLSDAEVAALPEEFVQGMERRAGMLGDVRVNHPRRWRLPALNWAQGVKAADIAENDPSPRVDLAGVHLMLQLRICNTKLAQDDARTLLLEKYSLLVGGIPAPRPLSVQWMSRLTSKGGQVREHFGFLDGQSQPVLKASETGRKYPNQVHLGEILLGHDNAADIAPPSGKRSEVQQLLRNGSFLVVRKLRQDVEALDQALAGALKDTMPDEAPVAEKESRRLHLLGKMMGRWPLGHSNEGKALATANPGKDNDFNFYPDSKGSLCPFHAHIRRSNPRDEPGPERRTKEEQLADGLEGGERDPKGVRPARLVRRGMSYGPLHDTTMPDEKKAASLAQERGIVFMAYNASIGEQFEVIQRWLTGGNSSGSFSGQSDPLLGLAEPGRPRYFRFEDDDGCPVRMRLDGSNRMHDDPRPFVRLEWGMYMFTPSLSAIKAMADRAKKAGKTFAQSWCEVQGEKEIARLRDIEGTQGQAAAFYAWKAAIEDPTSAVEFTAASIWAAIRKNHGGVLDTPFGVLVASRELVGSVLQDQDRKLTATGYLPRMHRSFGALYLGLDAGQVDGTYELESKDVNAAIMGLVATPADFRSVVAEAASVTCTELEALALEAIRQANEQCETHWEVTFEAREIIDNVLAHFCEKWFGVSQTGGYLKKSGMRWNWKPGEPPCYPGHFMAPSRYTFQPHPDPEVERIGADHGRALRTAISKYLAEFGDTLTQPVAVAALHCEAAKADPTYPTRTLAGVLMGFLPTTDGNIRRVLNEWLNEGTLWELRSQNGAIAVGNSDAKKALADRVRQKFVKAMQLRAAPELLWRTAATSHTIGKERLNQVEVRAGQMVVASLISATQECLEQGDPTLAYAFGGDRREAGHPTHACPGYGPAEAVMLGFFQGMVESGMALRPGPGALSLYMDGYVELTETCRQKAGAGSTAKPAMADGGVTPFSSHVQLFGLHATAIPPVPLLAIGDSWLYRNVALGIEVSPSLSTELEDLNYSSGNMFCRLGRTLGEMAQADSLAKVRRHLASMQGQRDAPRAILLGGGGNDLVHPTDDPTQTPLYKMLKNGALLEDKLQAFIDGTLKGHYRKILAVVTDETAVPILVHGYDHPIPDGKGSDLGPGPWLEPVFTAAGIATPAGTTIMKTLIDRLNTMIDSLATEFPNRIHSLKLNGVLEKEAGYAANYRDYWDNELHASDKGFDVLARVVQAKLVSLGIT